MKKTLLALTFLAVSLIGKTFLPVKVNPCSASLDQETVQTKEKIKVEKKLEKASLAKAARSVSGPNYGSGQSTLWTPVTEIEDGAVYMIRSAENPNLVWDLTNGSLNNGTQVQLYDVNYSHAQKFYIKKQFEVDGSTTYRMSPLFAYDKVLRLNKNEEYSKVVVGDETYKNDFQLFSDKFRFIPVASNPIHFYIAAVCDDIMNWKYTVDSVECGQKIIVRNHSSFTLRKHAWELVKTDYVGLNVGNTTLINGKNETRYVARVPYTGRYVVETHSFDTNVVVDTYLTLYRDSDGVRVDYSDDDGEGRNAKIVYNFETIEEFSIFVRGYSDNTHGFCYLVLRPEKTVYFSGTYDYDNQKCDRVTALNKCKNSLGKMGYFLEVQANFNHNSVYSEQDWEGKLKIDRDYYVFYGHGGNEGTYSAYFDSKNVDWVRQSVIPTLSNTGLMLWMTCRGGKEPDTGSEHCFAMAAAMKGATYSLGFRGDIYANEADVFVKEFFKARVNHTQESSIVIAAQNSALWSPVVFSNGGHTETRYSVSVFGFTKRTINH